MVTLHQLRRRCRSDSRNNQPTPSAAAAHRTAGWIAPALVLLLLLGMASAALANPADTIFLPLVVSGEDLQLAALDDRYQTFENGALIVSVENGVLANDRGPAQMQAVLESSAANGRLKFREDGSFVYWPARDFRGQDQFTYRARSGTFVSGPATVLITVSTDPMENVPRIVSGEIAFIKEIAGTNVKRAHFAYAADFDEDGDLDIVATHYGQNDGGIGGMVRWFENDGKGGFKDRILDPDLAGAYPAHVADVDLDGHIDVLAGGYDADTFAWYRNDGRAKFKRFNIDTTADGAHSIITNDLDQDGDIDFVTSGQDGNFISWYENRGANGFKAHIIDTEANGAKRAEAADLDGDGDTDVLAASFDAREIAWYENGGRQNFSKHVIDDKANGAYYVEPADIDGDGDIDMFSANRRDDAVAWYRNDGAGSFTKLIVDDSAIEVRTVVAADLDRDGDVDALAASVDDSTIAWHENGGSSGNAVIFTKRIIDSAADGAYAAAAVDIDSDGDLDVISASRNSGEIALHLQYRSHEASVAKGGMLEITSEQLLTVSGEEKPADLVYTITQAPKSGEIQVNGKPLAAGGTFTQADVDNGRVAYAHKAANKTPDAFSFSVAGSGIGGVKPATGTFAIKVN